MRKALNVQNIKKTFQISYGTKKSFPHKNWFLPISPMAAI